MKQVWIRDVRRDYSRSLVRGIALMSTRKKFEMNGAAREDVPGCRTIGKLFLDSGAHSLYNLKVRDVDDRTYAFYDSDEFWEYVDNYANFIKAHKDRIDLYVNVDAIFNPKKTWEVQKYLEEEHGLNPVPVVHYNTELRWLDRYINAGYKLIGIGGLGQEITKGEYFAWADQAFNLICSTPDRLPCVRTHGFAMTAYQLMIRYPWWGIDSASWAKAAGMGSIYVPHKRNGKFTFEENPYNIAISSDSSSKGKKGKHFDTLSKLERSIVLEWLGEIGMPLGKVSPSGEKIVFGVASEYGARATANMRFFDRLCKWLPPYPWAYKRRPKLNMRGYFGD